jgi:hypothetical protein
MSDRLVPPATVTVKRVSNALKDREYVLLLDGESLCTIREQSQGWKFWQRTFHTTVGAQQYHTERDTSFTKQTIRFLDPAGLCVAVDHNRTTLEYAGQRYGLEGWGALDWLVDAAGVKLLKFDWESGADTLQRVQINQPVAAELLAIATTVALAHGSNAGGG